MRTLKYAPERRAQGALCREKDRERETERERERAHARVLWMARGPLVLVLAAPELCGSVARLCVRVLCSSCPCLGRAPELCGWSV